MDISTRPATEADLDFAREAHHAAYRDVVIRQWGQWDEALQDEFFRKGWENAQFDVIVVDGIDCGYAAVEDRDKDVHVRELVIHPDYQSKGIGSEFLRSILARATERGVPVRLGTCIENYKAQSLYARLGFREIGRSETHILMEWQR